MRKSVLLGLALTLSACASSGGPPAGEFVAPAGCPALGAIVPAGVDGVRETVRYLADDALGGRQAGSEGERCAAEYIAWRMERAGLRPGGTSGWFSDVTLASVVNPHAEGGTGRNVIGVLDASNGDAEARTVVVGAHYDHLGLGEFGSLNTGAPAIHNGADDNASGVAALLEVAERLGRAPAPVRVVFVAFTGEEMGLLGSARYVNEPAVALERTVAMLNMDMVGRLREQPLIVNGAGTAPEWEALLRRLGERSGIELALSPDGYGPSDQTSFYARDIPVLHFFTNVHGEYHRPEDDWPLIDYDGIERIAGLVEGVVRGVGDLDAITLVRQAPPQPSGGGAGSGAWLGTVPDFTPVEHGVRLSGVSAGSPAEAAGFRAGDVIVRMGEHEIGDLYGLTDALRAHRPGDVVDVTVIRDGAELTRSVTLGSRASRSN